MAHYVDYQRVCKGADLVGVLTAEGNEWVREWTNACACVKFNLGRNALLISL